MPISKYIKIYTSEQSVGDFVLFSTRNASIVQIPGKIFRHISQLPERDRKILARHGMLLADPKREKKRMLKFVDDLNRLNRMLNLKIVMNLDCNLACRYCFEGNRKGKYYITQETSDQLIEFVKTRLDSEVEEVFVTFYGGEPLLSRQLITYIAKKLKSLIKRRGLSFSFALQTNGTLLTMEAVKELAPLGLTKVYVTIDGPKKNHDSFRPFKSGRGSSDTIIRNIKNIADMIEVQVSGNFTKGNYYRFPRLLDDFSEVGLTPDRIPSVQFYPVVSEKSEIVPDFQDGCSCINEPWLYEATLFLREETLNRGYRCDRVSPGTCMMELTNNLLVNYNGDIYKCPGLIGREEFCVGNISAGIKDYHQSHNLDNWKNEACMNCAYLPLCFGGCRYMKLVRDGNMNGVECKKPYLDATLEALVKQDIKYGLTNRK